MWPSINQCFPDPLAGQWPATHHPVLCECRQLYVLVSVCCCVPSTHLLVLHDGMSNSTVTSMPRGPTYLEFRISEQTEREAFCGFLMRAESASVSSAAGAMGGENLQMTVVCLQELSAASPQVISALMDVLTFGILRIGNTVRRVPSLRIVAFCDARVYASVLPEHLRSAFALSTYMSALSMESAAVIQSADAQSSNVVNKHHMLEVLQSADGKALVETVTLSGEVSRYLRHLVAVLRGAMLTHSAPGCHILAHLPDMLRLLKVVALLFAPSARARGGGPHLSLRLASPTSHHLRDAEPITSFAHVVVSPAHVMCLLCPMVAHRFTVQRAMVAPPCNNAAGGVKDGAWQAGIERTSATAALWDAKAVRWLSRLCGTSGDVAVGCADDAARLALSVTRDATRTLRELHEELLSYPECREVIRATVIQCSTPPSG